MSTAYATTEGTQGLSILAYPPKLSSDELVELAVWSRVCRTGDNASPLTAAYLAALGDLESQRRQLLDEGNEIVDVSVPRIPCHCWSGAEVANSLHKLSAILMSVSHGTALHELLWHIFAAIVAEAAHRVEHGR